jgi:hypothetical protein
MLVRSDDRAIDEVDRPVDLPVAISLALDGREDLLPDAAHGPAAEARVHRLPGPEPLREVTPRCPGRQLPQDAVEDPPIVVPRLARLVWWKQRPQPFPFDLSQLVPSPHTPPPEHTICQHKYRPPRSRLKTRLNTTATLRVKIAGGDRLDSRSKPKCAVEMANGRVIIVRSTAF